MGCAQSKCAGGVRAEGGDIILGHDGYHGGRQEDKRPSFDSSLTARPSQQEELQQPRAAAASSSALTAVSYGSFEEHRKSTSGGEIEDVGREEEGGSDNDASTTVGLWSPLCFFYFEFFSCGIPPIPKSARALLCFALPRDAGVDRRRIFGCQPSL